MKMNEKIIAFTSVALAYSGIIAVCYLLGYWNVFEVDILSYVSLRDIAVHSVKPVIINVILLLFIGFVVHKTDLSYKKSLLKRVVRGILDVFVVLILIYSLFNDDYAIWYIFIPFVLVFFAAIVAKIDYLERFIPHYRNRVLLIFVVTIMPSYSYLYGASDAKRIVEEEEYSYVSRPYMGLNDKRMNDLKYLGKMGDTYFLYLSSKNEVIRIPVSKTGNIHIGRVSYNQKTIFDWAQKQFDKIKENHK